MDEEKRLEAMLPPKARELVKRAAAQVKDVQAKDWLEKDERGTWEQLAARYLKRADEIRTEKGWTEEEMDEAVASNLALAALEARLRDERRRHGI
jgi:hypothetical protein